MSMDPKDAPPSLWQQLAAAQDASLDARTDRTALADRVVARVLPNRPLRRIWPWVGMGTFSAAALTAVMVVMLRGSALHFQMGANGVIGTPGQTLVADARSELPLRFSDGSVMTFQAGSIGQVNRLDGAGADVVLQAGHLDAAVVHAPRARWSVKAGPFRVRVTGTRFAVDWLSDRRSLEVTLHEGSVVVDGALLGAGVPLRAGQKLQVDLTTGVVRTLAFLPPATAGARAPQGATPPFPEPNDPPIEKRPTAVVVAKTEAWMTLAARGDYGRALHAAESLGLDDLMGRLDAKGLLALGDVARFAGAPLPARRAFAELVARFPNDRLTGDAFFSLGRLAFEAKRPDEAARWFERYVQEWPAGSLGELAAGRWLESAMRAHATVDAQRAARAYLHRAPAGPYSGLARQALAGARR